MVLGLIDLPTLNTPHCPITNLLRPTQEFGVCHVCDDNLFNRFCHANVSLSSDATAPSLSMNSARADLFAVTASSRAISARIASLFFLYSLLPSRAASFALRLAILTGTPWMVSSMVNAPNGGAREPDNSYQKKATPSERGWIVIVAGGWAGHEISPTGRAR